MDIGEILREVVNRDASDLHLSVGVPPVVRVDGHLENLDYPVLASRTTPVSLIYSILSQDQRQKLETEWEVDFSYSLYGMARFRVNAYFQRGTLSAAFRLVPVSIKTHRRVGSAQDTSLLLPQAAWLRPGHRPDRFGQVDHAGRHHRRDQPDRGPTTSSPSRTRSSSCTRTSAAWSTSERWAATPSRSRSPCAQPCARIPTSSSSVRCATWRPSRSP